METGCPWIIFWIQPNFHKSDLSLRVVPRNLIRIFLDSLWAHLLSLVFNCVIFFFFPYSAWDACRSLNLGVCFFCWFDNNVVKWFDRNVLTIISSYISSFSIPMGPPFTRMIDVFMVSHVVLIFSQSLFYNFVMLKFRYFLMTFFPVQ